MNTPSTELPGEIVEVTEEELWNELDALGVAGAVRQLVNRECARHNAIIERVVTAAGFKRSPGVDALCQALKNRKQAGLTVATLAEGLIGEVTALRRIIEQVQGEREATNGTEAQLRAIFRHVDRLKTVATYTDMSEAASRIDRYRRLAGATVPSSEVVS